MKAMTRVGAMLTTAAVMLACVLVAPWAMPASATPVEDETEPTYTYVIQDPALLTQEGELADEPRVSLLVRNEDDLADAATQYASAENHVCVYEIMSQRVYHEEQADGRYRVVEETGRCVVKDGKCPSENGVTTISSRELAES